MQSEIDLLPEVQPSQYKPDYGQILQTLQAIQKDINEIKTLLWEEEADYPTGSDDEEDEKKKYGFCSSGDYAKLGFRKA